MHIALLRGINVGGHRKVPMAELRALAENLGFRRVATYIQSGNLVFESDLAPATAAAKLETAIARRFGFPVDVVARTSAQWTAYARANPFTAESMREPERVMLLLSKAPPNAAGVAELAARATAGEMVKGAGDAVWIHYPTGLARTKLSPALIDRLLGSPATARNWRSVLALQALLGTPSSRG